MAHICNPTSGWRSRESEVGANPRLHEAPSKQKGAKGGGRDRRGEEKREERKKEKKEEEKEGGREGGMGAKERKKGTF